MGFLLPNQYAIINKTYIGEFFLKILEKIESFSEYISMIVIFTFLGMAIYAFSSKETPQVRAKNTILGGLISGALSYPTWMYVGQNEIWTLIPITITYTITGQFIPEFLQNAVPKGAKKIVNIIFRTKFGEDFDDDNKN